MYTGVPARVPVTSFTFLGTPTSVTFTELSSESLNVKERKQANPVHFCKISFPFVHGLEFFERFYGYENCEREDYVKNNI